MKDLREMGIEDIDRHLHCYKLFFRFLHKEKKFYFFKKLIFLDTKRSIEDLINIMNKSDLAYILIEIPKNFPSADQKWSAIFSYIPFFGTHWKKITEIDYLEMRHLVIRWHNYLIENKNKEI